MLNPITKKFTDESDENTYRFTFYCDLCGKPWHSIPYKSGLAPGANGQDRKNERIAAYDRANHEALMSFNRCPVCMRMLCDDCFRIFDDGDRCKECI